MLCTTIRRLLTALALAAGMMAAAPSLAADAAATPRATPVAVGDMPPDFTLTDHNGNQHALSAQRGQRPVVLIFYRGHW